MYLQENEGDELLDERPQLDLKNRGVQDILIALGCRALRSFLML